MKFSLLIVCMFAALGTFGCASSDVPPAKRTAAQPATAIDPALATQEYWIDKPGVSWVQFSTYDELWKACQQVAVDFQFTIDRLDYRDGVITTKPMVSAQFFEPWKRDVLTLPDLANSSIATHRRTIRFEITKLNDGSYEATPKVLIERQTIAERRITSAMYFRNVTQASNAYGTKETDEGIILSPYYWYAVGRDETLERRLAATVWNKVHPSGFFSGLFNRTDEVAGVGLE